MWSAVGPKATRSTPDSSVDSLLGQAYGSRMTNSMQLASKVQQADWLMSLGTNFQISPYHWTEDEADEILTHEETEFIDDMFNVQYPGYWL